MTTSVTKQSDIQHSWHLIDAQGAILGRLASQISILLQGKSKPYFSPNLDCGDYVVVINTDGLKVTGRKGSQHIYYRHSGFPNGLKAITFNEQMLKDSRRALFWTVSKMLPKNKLRQSRLNRLKLFKDANHIYQDKFQSKTDHK